MKCNKYYKYYNWNKKNKSDIIQTNKINYFKNFKFDNLICFGIRNLFL